MKNKKLLIFFGVIILLALLFGGSQIFLRNYAAPHDSDVTSPDGWMTGIQDLLARPQTLEVKDITEIKDMSSPPAVCLEKNQLVIANGNTCNYQIKKINNDAIRCFVPNLKQSDSPEITYEVEIEYTPVGDDGFPVTINVSSQTKDTTNKGEHADRNCKSDSEASYINIYKNGGALTIQCTIKGSPGEDTKNPATCTIE
jgi:hypothetical protein